MAPRATYHVVYWEAGEDGTGITLAAERSSGSRGRRPGAPASLCKECDGVSDATRFDLDAMHSSVRMLAKEGPGFRAEVEEFVCASPQLAIEYSLQRFNAYNGTRKKKVLTETVVLALPLLVHGGRVPSQEAGVNVTPLRSRGEAGDGDAAAAACDWLRGYASRVRSAASAEEGVSALAVVHPGGVEVSGFGVTDPFFAHAPQRPITRIVLLVAGPKGFGGEVALGRLEAALLGGERGQGAGGDGAGCHVGPFRLSVPARRPNAALGDLLMCHDRGMLLPLLEDMRHVGAEEYASWVQMLRGALFGLGASKLEMVQKQSLLGALEASMPPRPHGRSASRRGSRSSSSSRSRRSRRRSRSRGRRGDEDR